jgi:flavocytochrome c
MAIMRGLEARLLGELAPLVTIIRSSPVNRLLQDASGRVIGVSYTSLADGSVHDLSATAVILATGGYARAADLLAVYAPQVADLPSTNGPWSQGEGLQLGMAAGGDVHQLDNVQVHPTSFLRPSDPGAMTNILAAEALRGLGGILLCGDGARFTNELNTRGAVSDAILASCAPYDVPSAPVHPSGSSYPRAAWLVMSEEAAEAFGPRFAFYRDVQGFFQLFDSAQAFADYAALDAETVAATLQRYANDAAAGLPDQFGRESREFPPSNRPFFAAAITPAVHYTMGGLRVDASARVLSAALEPVQGLYAAGEVGAGVHGMERLGGNSLLDCVVFGRAAAAHAVAYSTGALAAKFDGSVVAPLSSELIAAGLDVHLDESSAVSVRPATVQQLSAVLRLASLHGTPLSTNGTSAPLSVLLDAINEIHLDLSSASLGAGALLSNVHAAANCPHLSKPLPSRLTLAEAVATGALRPSDVPELTLVLPTGDVLLLSGSSAGGADLRAAVFGAEHRLGLVAEATLSDVCEALAAVAERPATATPTSAADRLRTGSYGSLKAQEAVAHVLDPRGVLAASRPADPAQLLA